MLGANIREADSHPRSPDCSWPITMGTGVWLSGLGSAEVVKFYCHALSSIIHVYIQFLIQVILITHNISHFDTESGVCIKVRVHKRLILEVRMRPKQTLK